MTKSLLQNQKIRFLIIGFINTLIDFIIFFLLSYFGFSVVIANYISTFCGLIFSFVANRSFTFKASDKKGVKQFSVFLVITLFGLWVIQPLIIIAIQTMFATSTATLVFAKCAATGTTLIWNYFFYNKLVFHRQQNNHSSED